VSGSTGAAVKAKWHVLEMASLSFPMASMMIKERFNNFCCAVVLYCMFHHSLFSKLLQNSSFFLFCCDVAIVAEIENTGIRKTLHHISSFRSQQSANGENTVIYRTIQRVKSQQAAIEEEPIAPVIKATGRGRLIFVSLLVLLAAIMWSIIAGKGLWKWSST
jgi:hypothetical protein